MEYASDSWVGWELTQALNVKGHLVQTEHKKNLFPCYNRNRRGYLSSASPSMRRQRSCNLPWRCVQPGPGSGRGAARGHHRPGHGLAQLRGCGVWRRVPGASPVPLAALTRPLAPAVDVCLGRRLSVSRPKHLSPFQPCRWLLMQQETTKLRGSSRVAPTYVGNGGDEEHDDGGNVNHKDTSQ